MTTSVLTVAGFDPSCGAGLQADLKTIHALGCYAFCVPSLLTVQNGQGVREALSLDSVFLRAQMDAVLEDAKPKAAKTGALGSAQIVDEVARIARQSIFPWVVDPVLAPTSGVGFSESGLEQALCLELFPHAALVTPNADEAARLTGMKVDTVEDACEAAQRIAQSGALAVLVKGGHLVESARGVDVLWVDGDLHRLPSLPGLDANLRGTGCALSAAIACRLAHGDPLIEAVVFARKWLADVGSKPLSFGQGALVIDHIGAERSRFD